MAHLHDEWLAQDDHLEMWTGEVRHIRRRTPSQPICPTPISPDPLLSPPTRVLSLPLCPSPSFSSHALPQTQSGDFPLWRKRVLITQLAAQAWESVCARFDFEAAATRLGMRMTIDGSGDEQICIEGVDSYSFCDADGGDSGCESEEEAQQEEQLEDEQQEGQQQEEAEAEPNEPAEERADGRLADEERFNDVMGMIREELLRLS